MDGVDVVHIVAEDSDAIDDDCDNDALLRELALSGC